MWTYHSLPAAVYLVSYEKELLQQSLIIFPNCGYGVIEFLKIGFYMKRKQISSCI